MDRRIQKTREALRAALMSLLRDKALEQVEIQEITDRANTARVTFYRHYGTKEELLIDIIEQIYGRFEGLFTVLSVEQILDFRLTPPILPVFEMFETDRLFYKKLFNGTASALIQQRMRHYVVRQVTQTFGSAPRYANLPLFLIANHIASVIVGNVMWWLSDDLSYSAAYMAQVTHWTSLMGAMSLVGRQGEIILPPEGEWRLPEMY
jgi:AcrR family transcriptional regulator